MKRNILFLVIFLNIFVVGVELYFGFISNSMALVADAFHNLADVFALFVTLIALTYSEKEANAISTYGYHRSEMMGAFLNSLFLILTMIYVMFESLKGLFDHHDVESGYMILVALIAVVVNSFSAYLLLKINDVHYHDHEGHDHKDLNVHSSFLHMLGDAMLSGGVIVGGLLIYFFDIDSVDKVLAILFALYIIKSTYIVLIKSFKSLLDLNDDDISKFQNIILCSDQIENIHDFHITRPSSKDFHISAHLIFKENIDLKHIEKELELIREALKRVGVNHTLFQPESKKYENSYKFCESH